jgi:hypothetical protein
MSRNNEILAFLVQDDEADAGYALAAHSEMGRVDRLCGVEVGRDARKLVRPDHRHQRRMRAKPRRPDRLVRLWCELG